MTVSIKYANQFTFTCPVFDVDVRMGACMKLRDEVWRGRSPDVRKGCQAAMKCSMCPAAALVSLYAFNSGFQGDHHGSREPKKGRLQALVLDKIANVVPMESVVTKIAMSDIERKRLYSAKERVLEQLKSAPGEAPPGRASDYEAPKRRRSKPKTPDGVTDAAKSGDLSAAINQ